MKKMIVLVYIIVLMLMGCQSQGTEAGGTTEDSMEKNPVAGVVLKDFEAKDLDGNTVDQSIFAGSKLTVINLWGTFCGPCIDEMPGFEKVSKEFEPADVQILGVVIDEPTDEDAKELLKKLGVTYENIKPDQKLNELLVSKFDYVPVTLFVNNEGEIQETFIPGSAEEETLRSTIENLLK